jgi:predicted component of type VI protein secretion system
MSKPVPRSRLNITYRTRIDGQPVKQKLPMRFMILGDFSGGSADKLESRPVRSIKPGMKLDSFMKEMKLSAPIEDPRLATRMMGKLEGRVTGKIKKELPGGKAIVHLSGAGTVSGERKVNGLGDFAGEVRISGDVEVPLANEKVTIQAPLLYVLGAVEGGLTGRVDAKVTCTFEPGVVDVDALAGAVSGEVPVALTIPIRSLRSFAPEHIAASVPEIRRLMVMRRLLVEMRSSISGQSELRNVLKGVLESPELPKLREWLIANYAQLQLSAQSSATPAAGGLAQGSGAAQLPSSTPPAPPPSTPPAPAPAT